MHRCRYYALLTILAASSIAAADEPVSLTFRVEVAAAPEWRIADLDAVLEVSGTGLRGEVRVGRLEIPAAGLDLRDTTVFCGRVRLSRRTLTCSDGLLSAALPGVGRLSAAAAFEYGRDSGETRFDIRRLPIAGGTVSLAGTAGPAGSDVRFSAEALEIAGLVGIADELERGPGPLAAGGRVSAVGMLRTGPAAALELEIDARLLDASVSNESGTLVGEAVSGSLRVTAASAGAAWRFDVELDADRGEAYVEPVYANLAEQPVRLRAVDIRTEDFLDFDVGRFEFEQDATVSVSGSAALSLPRGDKAASLSRGSFEIVDTSVAALYSNLLQILATGTVLGDLETAGRVSGRLTVEDGELAAMSLELDGLILDDRQRRFAIYGLGGTFHWPGWEGDPDDAETSRLRWASATVHDIALHGAELSARFGGNDLRLLEPLRVPTMGGALVINRLVMDDYGSDEASGLLDAELEPIQLGQLTGAFGWPAFSGSLSGRLPLLQYEGNAMTVGGSLTARAFDGDIEVANLRIARPFSRVPRLTGDIRLRQLDLERLTNTFSFGLIQGRLSGDVAGLQMVGWRAVQMDLHLYTPPADRSPHRISQRAVENLASVGGGGAGAALSTGLLKFFEVFAYDRIGLRCVLRDGVCEMSGAGPAGEGPDGRGYYIVKGKGLPRIDVVGYRSRVSWQTLTRQLAAITRSSPPVVN